VIWSGEEIRITFAESVRNFLIFPALALWLCSVAVAQPHWSWRNPLPQGDNLNGVAWTGQQLMAVTSGGEIYAWTDGSVWGSPRRVTGNALYGIVSTGQRLIAVGVGGAILTAEQDPVGSAPWRIRLPETRPGPSRDLLGRRRSGSAFRGSFQPKSDP
jgi:hypothetical protein